MQEHDRGLRETGGASRRRVGTWRTYDVTDGLAAGCSCLLQDREGYLWLGTGVGLCRFDGESFTTFTVRHGLANDTIHCLCEDRHGRLWAGAGTGGISYLENGQFHALGPDEGLPRYDIWSLCEDAKGRIWFAALGGGIGCIDNGAVTRHTIEQGLASNMTRSIVCDQDGAIWIGTFGKGLCRFDGREFTRYGPEQGLPGTDIFFLHMDRSGNLWIGTRGNGVACFDGSSFVTYTRRDGLPQDSVRGICQDHDGHMWFATVGGGITCFDGKVFTTYGAQDGLLASHVSGVIEDREGHVWASHSLAGLSCFDPWTLEEVSEKPVSEVMVQDTASRIWFGDEYDLYCLDAVVWRSRAFPAQVFALTEDNEGRIWLATFGDGLYRFDSADDLWNGQGTQFTPRQGLGSMHIMSLLKTRDGTIWAGTARPGCLCRFNGETFEPIPTLHAVVFRLYEDSRGRIWLGGYEGPGLSCYDGKQMITYTETHGLPNPNVQSIIEDERQNLWIGTQYGLAKFDGERFETFSTEEGFRHFHHQQSAMDASGKLWFGTVNGGICRTDGKHFQFLTARDGLPSNSITALVPQPDGGMLIGTYRGVVRYRPTATLPPRIAIREMTADAVYPEPSAVTLSTLKAQFLTISYRGLSMGTERMRYSYRLAGFDDVWYDTWDDQVRYVDLTPGKYVFEVYAINRDLILSEKPATLVIDIVADSWEQIQAQYEARIGEMEEQLELHERASRQNEALIKLAKSKTMEHGDIDAALREIAKAAAETLGVDRASIWLFNETRDTLRCADCYDAATGLHAAGQEFPVTDWPNYFRAIEAEPVMAVENAMSDSRTWELTDEYLQPGGVASLLHASVRTGGDIAGVVFHERVGMTRPWERDEQHFARAIASNVALAIEARDRMRAEEQTRRMQIRLQNIIDSMPSVLIGVDKQGRVTHWNQKAAQVGCLTSEEATGLPFDVAFPYLGEDAGRVWQALANAAPIISERIAWRGADGDTLYYDLIVYPLDATGEQGAVIRLDDITARVKIEETMVQTEKMMSVGGLAAGMAHEINNPLGGILQACQNIVRRLSPDLPKNQQTAEQLGVRLETLHQYMTERGVFEFIEGIRADGARAAKIVADMLAFSRRSESHFAPVKLPDMVDTALRLAANDYDLKKHYDFRQTIIVREFEENLPPVRCEKTKIEQVLLNLIKNAAHSMAQNASGKEPVLTIRLEREPHHARIEIIDNGPGMDDAIRRRIFEPFFTTKEVGVGTGLGLSVSYFIITKQHRGTMTAESSPGAGARFILRIPWDMETP